MVAAKATGHEPNLEIFLRSLKGNNALETSTATLVVLLERRQIRGPEACAVATANLLRQIVAKSKWTDVDQLLDRIQQVGKKLTDAQPQELVLGNIVKRVLGLIRDEAEEDRNGEDAPSESAFGDEAAPATEEAPSPAKPARPPTLSSSASFALSHSFNLLSPEPTMDYSPSGTQGSGTSTPMSYAQATNVHALRSEVIDGIEEIMDEIVQTDDLIASFADVHIHPGDTVLAYAPSATAEKFLMKAASKRKFTVFLGGEPPRGKEEPAPYARLRKKLEAAKVTVVRMASLGAMCYMPKVSKVVLDADAITAAGAVLAGGGAELVARAARHLGRPVIVLGGTYKVAPQHTVDGEVLRTVGDAGDTIGFSQGDVVGGPDVENGLRDCIDAEFIDMYITNLGPASRDHLQTLIDDHYKDVDMELYQAA